MSETSLSLRFMYKGELAGEPYEVKPSLLWWSSTVRSFKRGTSRTEIKWSDEERQISEEGTVHVPLSKTAYRLDDRIWVECMVNSPNEEGFYVGARAGAASITLKSIFDSVKSSGKYSKTRLPLEMAQMRLNDGNPYQKGSISIELSDRKDIEFVKGWKFQSPGTYDITEENAKQVNALFNMCIVSSLFPYSETASKKGLAFEPSSSRIEGIHAPVWTANVDVPGWAYWTEYSEYEPDELFWENLVTVALDRCEVDREWFLRVADAQFSRKDGRYDENFHKVIEVMAVAVTIPSVSLYYKGDESYVVEDGGSGFFGGSDRVSIIKKMIESFNDALVMRGDDCEGLGALIHRTMRILKRGIPARKGNAPWNENGSWREPVLKHLQHLAYWYVSGGPLGSVTAARVGGAEARRHPLIIDSREDLQAKLGAHMWQESIPVVQFEERMRRTNSTLFDGINLKLRKAEYPKWLHRLPYTIGEGTGAVHPFLRPISEYYESDAQLRTEAVNKCSDRLLAARYISENTSYLSMGQVQRIQKMMGNIEDARFSDFYRRTTTFHTDDLFAEGYPVAEFVWTQLSPRMSESDERVGRRRSTTEPWTWGVNMRDKLRSESSEGRQTGLITVPPLEPEEMNAVRSLLRQLPPLQTPTLTPKRKAQLEQYAEPFIKEFQKLSDHITTQRHGERDSSRRVDVIFRKEEFFRGMIDRKKKITLRDGLLDDIEKNEQIHDVHVVFEPITDNIYNVRLEVHVNVQRTKSAVRSISTDNEMKRSLFSTVLNWIPTDIASSPLKEIYHFNRESDRKSFRQGIERDSAFHSNVPCEMKAFQRGLVLNEEMKKRGFSICTPITEKHSEVHVNNDFFPSL